MNSKAGYWFERIYPYAVGVIAFILCKKYNFNVSNNSDYKEVLNGLVTLDSIIIGFLGAIMPVILSMKNESKFVRYVFERDRQNLFSKYLKVTIFLGLSNAVLSLVMHVRGNLPLCIKNDVYYFWVFITVTFMVATYRSMSHMINLIFAKDDLQLEHNENSGISDARRQELREKYSKNQR